MSPEAILGGSNNILGGPAMKVGRASDIWSLGCILYQMVFGRTPFADLPFIQKMHAICNPGYEINYPFNPGHDVLDTIRRCLDRDPKSRISMAELLDHASLHPERASASLKASQEAVAMPLDQLRQLLEQVRRPQTSRAFNATTPRASCLSCYPDTCPDLGCGWPTVIVLWDAGIQFYSLG